MEQGEAENLTETHLACASDQDFPQEEARKAKEILKLTKYYKLGAWAMVVHHHMQRAKPFATWCLLKQTSLQLGAPVAVTCCKEQSSQQLCAWAPDSWF